MSDTALADAAPSRPTAITGKPSWSLAGAAVVLLVAILAGSKLLGDPDTQWHIAVGRWMLENRAFPVTDTMSFTFEGHRWIAKEWLSQLLLATAHAAGGWPGVALVTAAAVSGAVWLIMAASGGRQGALAGLACGLLAFLFVAPTAVARPHVLVFPVVAAWTIALMRATETSGRPPWRALPLLVVWANMHAGFSMGFVIAGAFGLEALIKATSAERMRTAARWLAFGLACLVAGITTPYGAEPLMLNLELASGNEAMQFIGEWKRLPATPHTALLLAVAAVSLLALAQAPRENAARLLLVAFLTYTMVKHERFVMIFGLVMPIIACGALTLWCARVATRLDLFQRGDVLPDGHAPTLVAGLSCSLALILLVARPMQPPPNVAPVGTFAAVPLELRQERVFNSYDLGGFLALQGVDTFIDGRTDQLFLGGFMTRMMTAASAPTPAPLAALLDAHKIQWAIIGSRKPEARLFPELAGWRAIRQDAAAHVYVRAR